MKSLVRVGSDHIPILLNSGEGDSVKNMRFFFEKKWLCQENFRDLLKNKWFEINRNASNNIYSLGKWNGCIASLRRSFLEVGLLT